MLDRLVVPVLCGRGRHVVELDPCSNARSIVPAARVFDRRWSDGLREPWRAETVFMNPPYSACRRWCRKAAEERELGNARAILGLLPASVSSYWWLEAVATVQAFALLRGRIAFGGASNGAMFGSALMLWTHRDEFVVRLREAVERWGGTVAVRMAAGYFAQWTHPGGQAA